MTLRNDGIPLTVRKSARRFGATSLANVCDNFENDNRAFLDGLDLDDSDSEGDIFS